MLTSSLKLNNTEDKLNKTEDELNNTKDKLKKTEDKSNNTEALLNETRLELPLPACVCRNGVHNQYTAASSVVGVL